MRWLLVRERASTREHRLPVSLGKRNVVHRPTWTLLALVVSWLAAVEPSRAQCSWPQTPGASPPVDLGASSNPAVTADASGGFFVAYASTDGGMTEVELARVAPTGDFMWSVTVGPAVSPPAACLLPVATVFPVVCEDGAGGVFVAWTNAATCTLNVWAAHVTEGGGISWSAIVGGPTPGGTYVSNVRIAYDDGGGAWLAFHRMVPGAAPDAIYVNHVDTGGTILFGTTGILAGLAFGLDPVVPAIDAFMDPGVGSSAVLAWGVAPVPPGPIFVMRVTFGGPVWPLVDPTTPFTDGFDPVIVHDGMNGAIVAWETTPATGGDIHFQHIDEFGFPVLPEAAQVVCGAAGDQSDPRIVSDGAGGAIIAWSDPRNAGLYAQRVSGDMAAVPPVYWAADGIPVTQAAFMETAPAMTADLEGGAVLVWSDSRGGSSLYAQRLSALGELLWEPAGVPVAVRPGMQTTAAVARIADAMALADPTLGDPKFEFAVAWSDDATPLFADEQVLLQKLDAFGTLGCPEPMITSIADISGDQGGFVAMAFTRSDRDDLPVDDIDFYSIWRRLPGDVAKSASVLVMAPSALTRELLAGAPAGSIVRPSPAGTPPGLWELVGTQAAHRAAQGYTYAAATRFDESPFLPPGSATHSFFVSAHSVRPRIWWDSDAATGLSYDNLAPAVPQALTVTQPGVVAKVTSLPLQLVLNWAPNREADLGEYVIYRGANSQFVPAGPNDVYARVRSSTFVDSVLTPWTSMYYRVAAIDVHGNEGPYSEARGTLVRTDAEFPTSISYSLSQNEPNPARGTTLIRWSLAEAGPVRLTVYDVAGRAVRALVATSLPGGRHALAWDTKDSRGNAVAAGIYFCRLEAGTFVRTRRMTVMR